ncbi:hypothetical protein ACIGHN_02335 [Acidovorax sp. NPDC077693]|uniref:hypothetical protein n=1 Tax=unclassified Acidovorax TaxID=2684926 RepID=UPI0037CBA246
MKGWPDFTVGQLLDKRKACSSTEWKSFTDTRDRKVVEYQCTYSPGGKYMQERSAEAIEEENGQPARQAESNAYYLGIEQKQIDHAKEQLADAIDRGVPVESFEQAIARAENAYEKKKQLHAERASQDDERHGQRLALFKRRAANFREVLEISQWAIQDGSPVYLGSKIQAVFDDRAIDWPVNHVFVFEQASQDSPDLTESYRVYLGQMWEQYR